MWTSPRNAIAIVEALSQWMQAHDDENAAFYAQNTADYVQQLTELDSDYRTMVEHSARKTILFGDRFPFRYLADAYGLEYYAAFSGCSTETEASAQTVKFLSDKIVSDKLPVVFTIEFSNGKIADSIADATGAKRLELHSCHNLSAEQMAAGVTYLELMQQNLKALEEALTE